MLARRKNTITTFVFLLFSLSICIYPQAKAEKRTLMIFAASSLTESYSKLGKTFESQNPNVSIKFSFLSSSTLATQLIQGAPADLFISASPSEMNRVASRIIINSDYVTNYVVLAVPRNSKKNIKKIRDINRKDILWIQCAHTAPCGEAADRALASENVLSKPISFEPNVSSVVGKLLMGTVDAGICYHTDIMANIKVLRGIPFSDVLGSKTQYSLGILEDSGNYELATTFAKFLKSKESLEFLKRKGFGVANLK